MCRNSHYLIYYIVDQSDQCLTKSSNFVRKFGLWLVTHNLAQMSVPKSCSVPYSNLGLWKLRAVAIAASRVMRARLAEQTLGLNYNYVEWGWDQGTALCLCGTVHKLHQLCATA